MCKLIRFLYKLVPFLFFRAVLNRKHIAVCQECQKEWGIDTSIEEVLSPPEWIKNEQSLWPQIRETIGTAELGEVEGRKRREVFFFPGWQWALAGLALLIMVGINIVLDKGSIPAVSRTAGSPAVAIPQIKIIRAEISGKKAKPYIYRTQENVYIWFDEIDQEED